MKKSSKFAIIFILVGIILITFGRFSGANPSFSLRGWKVGPIFYDRNYKKESYSFGPVEKKDYSFKDIASLELSTAPSDITLIGNDSEEWTVSYKSKTDKDGNSLVIVEDNDGILKISSPKKKIFIQNGNYNPETSITISGPTKELKSTQIDVSMGELSLENVELNNFTMNDSMGVTNIENSILRQGNLDVSMATYKIEDSKLDTIEFNMSMGTIKGEDIQFFGKNRINASMSSLKFDILDPENSLAIYKNSEHGDDTDGGKDANQLIINSTMSSRSITKNGDILFHEEGDYDKNWNDYNYDDWNEDDDYYEEIDYLDDEDYDKVDRLTDNIEDKILNKVNHLLNNM